MNPSAFNSAICIGSTLAGGAIGYSAANGHIATVLITVVAIVFGSLSAMANSKSANIA